MRNLPMPMLVALMLMALTTETWGQAKIEQPNNEACTFRLVGDIEDGDGARLIAAINAYIDGAEVHPAFTSGPELSGFESSDTEFNLPYTSQGNGVILCLDSGGGSFSEAVNFIRATLRNDGPQFATKIEAHARCLSACSLIFLVGRRHLGDGAFVPARRLHVQGQLGFHAPHLQTASNSTNDRQLRRSYQAGVAAVARVLGFDSTYFPKTLLIQMLLKGPEDNFFMIDKVRQAGVWEISLYGYKPPVIATEADVRVACDNAVEWKNAKELQVTRELEEEMAEKVGPVPATDELAPLRKKPLKLKGATAVRSYRHYSGEMPAVECAIGVTLSPERTPVDIIIIFNGEGMPDAKTIAQAKSLRGHLDPVAPYWVFYDEETELKAIAE